MTVSLSHTHTNVYTQMGHFPPNNRCLLNLVLDVTRMYKNLMKTNTFNPHMCICGYVYTCEYKEICIPKKISL